MTQVVEKLEMSQDMDAGTKGTRNYKDTVFRMLFREKKDAGGDSGSKVYRVYNGEAKQPERKCMYLSDLYAHKPEELSLELVVVQLNITAGYNEELKKNCPTLMGYM